MIGCAGRERTKVVCLTSGQTSCWFIEGVRSAWKPDYVYGVGGPEYVVARSKVEKDRFT